MKQLINKTIRKQQLLKSNVAWKSILMNVPPILWFGNMNSDKQKIVTIGANPSDREFCSKTGTIYNRFVYSTPYNAINLEKAYNEYFQHNPYRGWFGAPSGGRVEAFLNGLDASYYDNSDFTYQAIHIDFFPFATNKKFKDMDWNTSCASSTGATVEMLLKFYNIKPVNLKFNSEKYNVTCGIFGFEKIMDDISNGVDKKDAVSKFIHGIAFNAWKFAKNPSKIYLSGGFCQNKCFLKSLSKYCIVEPLGRFILVEGLLRNN